MLSNVQAVSYIPAPPIDSVLKWVEWNLVTNVKVPLTWKPSVRTVVQVLSVLLRGPEMKVSGLVQMARKSLVPMVLPVLRSLLMLLSVSPMTTLVTLPNQPMILVNLDMVKNPVKVIKNMVNMTLVNLDMVMTLVKVIKNIVKVNMNVVVVNIVVVNIVNMNPVKVNMKVLALLNLPSPLASMIATVVQTSGLMMTVSLVTLAGLTIPVVVAMILLSLFPVNAVHIPLSPPHTLNLTFGSAEPSSPLTLLAPQQVPYLKQTHGSPQHIQPR